MSSSGPKSVPAFRAPPPGQGKCPFEFDLRRLPSVGEFRPDSRWFEPSQHFPAFSDTLSLNTEEVLLGDHISLGSGDPGDVYDPPRSVGEATQLDHKLKSSLDMLSDAPSRRFSFAIATWVHSL